MSLFVSNHRKMDGRGPPGEGYGERECTVTYWPVYPEQPMRFREGRAFPKDVF